jgi:hypothetical protein
MRRLQPKIASRLASGLAAEGPCPDRFAVLLERLARLRADFGAGPVSGDAPARRETDQPEADDTGRRTPGCRSIPRR